ERGLRGVGAAGIFEKGLAGEARFRKGREERANAYRIEGKAGHVMSANTGIAIGNGGADKSKPRLLRAGVRRCPPVWGRRRRRRGDPPTKERGGSVWVSRGQRLPGPM